MPKCRTWASEECMEALANPDRNVAAQLYVQKLQKIMSDCKDGAEKCIERNAKTPNVELKSMIHEYNVFKIESQKGLDAIIRNDPSAPICKNAANYCSTCKQLWGFCPKA